MFKEIFILLILFQIKHFLCDFPLQGKYMLGKFKGGISGKDIFFNHPGWHDFTYLNLKEYEMVLDAYVVHHPNKNTQIIV